MVLDTSVELRVLTEVELMGDSVFAVLLTEAEVAVLLTKDEEKVLVVVFRREMLVTFTSERVLMLVVVFKPELEFLAMDELLDDVEVLVLFARIVADALEVMFIIKDVVVSLIEAGLDAVEIAFACDVVLTITKEGKDGAVGPRVLVELKEMVEVTLLDVLVLIELAVVELTVNTDEALVTFMTVY